MKTKANNNLRRWHETINQDSVTIADRMNLVIEELQELQTATSDPQKIKEAVDVYVTAYAVWMYHPDEMIGVAHFNLAQSMAQTIEDAGINPWQALEKVNESNFSKLIHPAELEAAAEHFDRIGLEVVIQPVGDLFGAYSRYTQTIDNKEYLANKLVKGPFYHAIEEHKDGWWL